MKGKATVFLTATESKDRYSLRVDGETVGDVVLNPSKEAEKRLLTKLTELKFGSEVICGLEVSYMPTPRGRCYFCAMIGPRQKA